MASYAGEQTFQQQQHQYQAQNMRNDSSLSVLAQAKPAIISSNGSEAANGYLNGCNDENMTSNHHHQRSISFLAEKLDNALKTSALSNKAPSHDTRLAHIEDDNVIHKQNASNQMRQAAVMAAVASQQQKAVRLSATERLAMTAKRPQQQTPDSTSHQSNNATTKASSDSIKTVKSAPSLMQPNNNKVQAPKSAPMPTLETLLAVQRQLQQHTRQNLTSVPRDTVKGKLQQSANGPTTAEAHVKQQKLDGDYQGRTNGFDESHDTQDHYKNEPHDFSETYDKDLPPLPDSVSPSTMTDDSQLNSLESQSSPATSLVSLPPPPPPLSTYLQQYDETSHTRSSSSTSSTPSTTCSSSDMSSVRQFPGAMPVIKQQSQQQVPHKINTKPSMPPPPPPPLAPKPAHLEMRKIAPVTTQTHNKSPTDTTKRVEASTRLHNNTESKQDVNNTRQINYRQHMFHPEIASSQCNLPRTTTTITATSMNQLKVEERIKRETSPGLPSSFSAPHLLPPPPSMLVAEDRVDATTVSTITSSSAALNCDGFDETDCGTFRFPTPPPLEMLLDDNGYDDDKMTDIALNKTINCATKQVNQVDDDDADDGHHSDEDSEESSDDSDEDEDEDFQCKIPTPPPHKSMSAASFQSLVDCPLAAKSNHVGNANNPLFNSSTFSAPNLANKQHYAKSTNTSPTSLQPPPLFRQQQQDEQHGRPLQSQTCHQQQTAHQLTVHINTDEAATTNGLLATSMHSSTGAAAAAAGVAGSRVHGIQNNHNHHHHMIMAMTASSSSPSSSSDGDGQSSNSSSSTSGIHSSIDSPSSSNSKLDDFNYGGLVGTAASAAASRTILADHHQRTSVSSSINDNGSHTKTLPSRLMQQPQLSYQQHQQHLYQPQPQQVLSSSPSVVNGYKLSEHQKAQVESNAAALLAASKALAASAARVSSTMAPPQPRSTSSVHSASPVTTANSSATRTTSSTTTTTTRANLLRKTSISSTSSLQSLASVTSAPGTTATAARRPALKQKKTVSFSDKVELVACAEEQCDDHLPNPLLARVLAGKLQ